PLKTHPRLLIKNNLAWAAVMTKNGYRAVARPGTQDAVEVAIEAAIDSGWQRGPTLHTLAVALYQRALEQDLTAASDGWAVSEARSELQSQDPELPRLVATLRDCFDRVQERIPVSKCAH